MSKEYDGSTPLKAPKQEQFCLEYIVDLNGAGAAKRAGYSEKTAVNMASRLLTIVNIQKRIEYLKTQNVERVRNKSEIDFSADRVLEEMAKIAFCSINDFITVNDDGYAFIDLSKTTPHQMAALQSVETVDLPPLTLMSTEGEKLERQVLKIKIKLWDKVKALETLMKHHGLTKEAVEVEGLDKLIENLHEGRARVAARDGKKD